MVVRGRGFKTKGVHEMKTILSRTKMISTLMGNISSLRFFFRRRDERVGEWKVGRGWGTLRWI